MMRTTALCFLVTALWPGTSSAAEAFEDATDRLGLGGLSGSVAAWGDFNNDGWVDLYVGGELWRNEKGERFTRVENTPLAGAGIWGDFNNDGYLDLFSWAGAGKLFRNVSGEAFEVVAGFPELPTTVSLGASWGDFNGDGFLDLYVGGYEVWPAKEYPDVILLNQAGEGFIEHWRQQGKIYRARGVTSADFDEDGDLDVYVSNYRLQPNRLLQNDGRATFVEASTPLGTAGDGDLGAWGHTIGSAWGDLDNDGHFDLFVGNFSHPPAYQDRAKFLRNRGPDEKFHFEDMTVAAGLRWQESYASPTLGDFDNDGLLDLFLTTVYAGDKSVLYRNTGDWKFEEVSGAAQVDRPTTYQGAWADFDGDGYLDLLTGARLLRNPGGENHWLKVRLLGSENVNAGGIGGQVRLKLADQTLTRQVEGATGQGNQNDLTLHFGVGSQAGPVRLEIRWPNGRQQVVETPVDRTVTVDGNPR